ncbi:MAG TPA: MFS transporter [Solirubrobacteraceae bacterium]|jgi:MFS family permease|nr:MFS transporter [Solirubrobacteraceae bacterium]
MSSPTSALAIRAQRARVRAPQLSGLAAFAAVAAVIAVAFYASATPSPLYGVYQARWHFSTPVLSLVYATYAIGVLVSLLLVGSLSDQTGRRPVLAWSLLALLVSALVFATASSLAWLFAARALQGLATGAALGAAGAALIDLHPTANTRTAALVNGVVALAGLGVGALLSSALVQFLPAPRELPFVVVAAMIALLLALVGVMPEPVSREGRTVLRPQRPAIPHQTRGPFALAALGVIGSWSIAGVYLALGPALAGHLLQTQGELAGGVAAAALMGSGALAQLAARNLTNRTLTVAGSLLVALGMALTATAVAVGSAAFFLAASALAGVGFGLAFMGSLRHLSAAIPADRRAEVMSAFYIVGYLSLALPAIAAGFIANAIGLSETFELLSAGVVVVALSVAAGGRRIDRELAV